MYISLTLLLTIDFERRDDDELGFRKNDIITIISQKDEHCWVGELNGLRGSTIFSVNIYIYFYELIYRMVSSQVRCAFG